MKNFIYLFTALLFAFSVTSCKRISDADGDLLNDLDANQGGLTGARFLYQEYNSVDTIAEYHYTGKKLTEVVGKRFKTQVIYNGDQINKIIYNGVIGTDSLSYTQFFNYDIVNNNRLSTITEVRSKFPNVDATTPGAEEKYKSIYTIKFAANGKLDSVIAKSGKEIPAQQFAFTSYEKTSYIYNAAKTNVTRVDKNYGGLVGNTFLPPSAQKVFVYSDYDDKKSPYSLIPFGYILHKTIEEPLKNFWFSANNPKKLAISTEMMPVPTEFSTQYTYDPQLYALSGFGIMYDYRPF